MRLSHKRTVEFGRQMLKAETRGLRAGDRRAAISEGEADSREGSPSVCPVCGRVIERDVLPLTHIAECARKAQTEVETLEDLGVV